MVVTPENTSHTYSKPIRPSYRPKHSLGLENQQETGYLKTELFPVIHNQDFSLTCATISPISTLIPLKIKELRENHITQIKGLLLS